MMSYEELETLVNAIREKIGEDASAMVSEDLLNIVSNYKLGIDEVEKLTGEVDSLKAEKDELLKVNGKLFQKVGFEKEVVEDEIIEKHEDEKTADEIIDDLIDERGEIKDGE
jgi:hypothetical protein